MQICKYVYIIKNKIYLSKNMWQSLKNIFKYF